MEIVNPQMLILARESRGMTQSELARAVGVTQGKVSKYENGMLLVSREDLDKIAAVLDYTPDFFFQQDKVYGLGSSFLFHRQRQRVPMMLQRKIQADVNIMRMQVERLLRSAEIKCDNRFTPIDIDELGGNAARAADRIRATWSLPLGPIPNLMQAVESAGGIIIKCAFGTDKIDASHLWLPDLPPLFFVNRDMPADRLRFTLAHEIGHAIMHSVPTESIEDEANQFAAELLMPQKEIRKHLRGLTLQRAAMLKPHWRVSMAAIIKRAKDLGCISAQEYSRLFTSLSTQGYRTNEPIPISADEPAVLRELVAVHRTALGYTDADLGRLLYTADSQFFDPEHAPVRLRLVGKRTIIAFRERLNP